MRPQRITIVFFLLSVTFMAIWVFWLLVKEPVINLPVMRYFTGEGAIDLSNYFLIMSLLSLFWKRR